MATTLAMRRKYRKSLKKSLCRKKTMRKCNRVRGCKNTKKTAKKPRYCRKKHNKRHTQKGGDNEAAIVVKCFQDCRKKHPELDANSLWTKCAGKCQPGHSLYRATAKRMNLNA